MYYYSIKKRNFTVLTDHCRFKDCIHFRKILRRSRVVTKSPRRLFSRSTSMQIANVKNKNDWRAFSVPVNSLVFFLFFCFFFLSIPINVHITWDIAGVCVFVCEFRVYVGSRTCFFSFFFVFFLYFFFWRFPVIWRYSNDHDWFLRLEPLPKNQEISLVKVKPNFLHWAMTTRPMATGPQ